jgi:hypothetical protein
MLSAKENLESQLADSRKILAEKNEVIQKIQAGQQSVQNSQEEYDFKILKL